MEYSDYSANDFALDEYFQKWVLLPEHEVTSFWEAWIAQNPEKEALINEARELVLLINFNTYEFEHAESSKVWENIDTGISDYERSREKVFSDDTGSTPFLIRRWYKVAAVFAGFMVISLVGILLKKPPGLIVYNTGYGERKTILLPDSSTVVLNANSSLEYFSDWDGEDQNLEEFPTSPSARRVWLTGEAYFSVMKVIGSDARGAKFLVYTPQLNVEVLGTRFNVSNRRGKTEVVLNSGKVKLSTSFETADQADTLIMKPGELVELSDEDREFTIKEVDPEEHSAWRNNKLIFDEIPLSQMAMILDDNYGIKVIFEDSTIGNKKFKGTFPADNVEVLITTLSMSFDIKVSEKKDQITFLE